MILPHFIRSRSISNTRRHLERLYQITHETYIEFDINPKMLYICWLIFLLVNISADWFQDYVCQDINSKPELRVRMNVFEPETGADKRFYHNTLLDCDEGVCHFDWNVTMVTQASFDRWATIRQHLVQWSGPISIAILVNPSEAMRAFETIAADDLFQARRRDVRVHFVESGGESLYPTNLLRNVALDGAVTTHVFLNDADFISPKDLHARLMLWLDDPILLQRTRRNMNYALVIPAFEVVNNANITYPETKNDLRTEKYRGSIAVFHEERCEACHHATNMVMWLTKTTPYKVDYEHLYEPYVVMRREAVPRYDERFNVNFRDKIAHIYHVSKTDVTFVVLPDAYVIHMPHSLQYRENLMNTRPLKYCGLRLWKKHTAQVHVETGRQ